MVLAVWTLRFAALEACHALAIGAGDFMALVADILGVAGIAKILLAGVAKKVGGETVLRAKLAFVRIRSDTFVAKELCAATTLVLKGLERVHAVALLVLNLRLLGLLLARSDLANRRPAV